MPGGVGAVPGGGGTVPGGTGAPGGDGGAFAGGTGAGGGGTAPGGLGISPGGIGTLPGGAIGDAGIVPEAGGAAPPGGADGAAALAADATAAALNHRPHSNESLAWGFIGGVLVDPNVLRRAHVRDSRAPSRDVGRGPLCRDRRQMQPPTQTLTFSHAPQHKEAGLPPFLNLCDRMPAQIVIRD